MFTRQKEHFRWKEPKVFLKYNYELELSRLKWWFRPALAIGFMAMLMITAFVARLNTTKNPSSLPVAFTVAIIGGITFIYVIPWMYSLLPSEIRLYDTYLARLSSEFKQIKYKDIVSFSLRDQDGYSILILKVFQKNREIIVGIPSEVSLDAVSCFLIEHNVKFESATS